MKNIIKRVFVGILLISTISYMFFQSFTIETYAKDDPYSALAKATTVYNGVDYKNE